MQKKDYIKNKESSFNTNTPSQQLDYVSLRVLNYTELFHIEH